MTEKKLETPKIGDHVIFFDQFGMEHNALLTAVHGETHRSKTFPRGTTEYTEENLVDCVTYPSVNLVLVSPDSKREDSYGRQLERESSCVYHMDQSAWGNFYCFPEDVEQARMDCLECKRRENADI